MKRILVVEDDVTLSTGIILALREEQTAFVQACLCRNRQKKPCGTAA